MIVLVLMVPLAILAALSFFYSERHRHFMAEVSKDREVDPLDLEFERLIAELRSNLSDDDDLGGDLVGV